MTESIKDTINRADPNSLPDVLRDVNLGDALLALPRTMTGQLPVAGVIALADACKCRRVIAGWAHSTGAAGTLGNLTPIAYAAAPADGEIGWDAAGNIVVNSVSAYTSVDVVYEPIVGDVVTMTLPVVTNVATIPAAYRPVLWVNSVTGLVGTTTGSKLMLAPGAGGPAATQCRPNLALTTLTFNAADALTSISATFVKAKTQELGARLLADSPYA